MKKKWRSKINYFNTKCANKINFFYEKSAVCTAHQRAFREHGFVGHWKTHSHGYGCGINFM